MEFVMQLTLDTGASKANIKNIIVYVNAPADASLRVLAQLAEEKVKQQMPSYSRAFCLAHHYLGRAASVDVVR